MQAGRRARLAGFIGAVLVGACACMAAAQSLGDLANQVLQGVQNTGNPATAASAIVTGTALSETDIAAALRQALGNGTRAAVAQLGRTDGFWGDARFRVPLPRPLQKLDPVLQAAGYGPQVEQLHLSLNRAAEQAVPLAAEVFGEAVQKLTISDARAILQGPPDAATQYFKRSTADTLSARFLPVVTSVTSRLDLVQRYNAVLDSAGPAAALLGDKADVNRYVTQKALDALFARVGDEERAIRSNPAARTTALLKKVFGG